LIDGALLALGNGHNLSTLMLALIIIDHSLDTHVPDPLPRRPLPHDQLTKDVLLFSRGGTSYVGTVCFLGGILLVFIKWPAIGVFVEMFGLLNLFGCVSSFFLAASPSCPSLPVLSLPFE
jgi:hypothetical protein